MTIRMKRLKLQEERGPPAQNLNAQLMLKKTRSLGPIDLKVKRTL